MSLTVSWPDRQRWVYFVFASLQILGMIGITSAVIDNYTRHGHVKDNVHPAYAISLLLTSIAMWYFVANGIFFEQKWRIIFFVVASVLVFGYALYSYVRDKEIQQDERLARLVIASVCLPINAIWSFFIVGDMDWLAFHVAGSDEQRMDAYHWINRFRSFLDLDLMLAITLVVMASFSHTLSEPQLGVAISGLVLSLLWIVVGTAGARRESTLFMTLFYLLSTLEPAFIFFKFAEISDDWDRYSKKDTTNPVLLLGSAALVLRIVVVGFAIKVHRNFNLGLKEALLHSGQADAEHYRTI